MSEQIISERLSKLEWEVATIKQAQVDLKEDTKEMHSDMKSDYVSKYDFAPVKLVVYGLCGTVLATVLGAILTLVITKL